MPLTCNAVGDVLALIELAIVIAKFLNDCRGAPAECRALCNELRSLQRLLVLSRPTILALRDESVRQLVEERLEMVSARIDEGLQLIVKFNSAFAIAAAADPAQGWRATLVLWVTKGFQSIEWTLRKSADAEACRATIAQSFEPLIFSLLIAFQADQKAVLGVLQEAFTDLADEVKAGHATAHDLTAGQEALRVDTLFLKDALNKHLMALLSVREDVSNIGVQFANALAATRLDIADVRRRLEAFCSTADTAAQDSASTRAMLETFVITVSDKHLADRDQFTIVDTKLDQMMELLTQKAAKTSKERDLVHNRGIPGLRQLRAAAARAYDLSPHLVSAVTRAVLSEEAITTSIGIAMAASNSIDKVAGGVAAVLLVMARKACQLYKAPVVVHVVFVEDFFGFALELATSKCSSPQEFHTALAETFKGRMGSVLIQRRKYELQLVDYSTSTRQASPWKWERPLESGARIHMNTFVRHEEPLSRLSNNLICPACTAQFIQSTVQDDSWVACTFCLTMVQVTRQRAAEYRYNAQKVENLTNPPTDDASNSSVTSPRGIKGKPNETSAGDWEEQAALRRCRRIRIIQPLKGVMAHPSSDMELMDISSNGNDVELHSTRPLLVPGRSRSRSDPTANLATATYSASSTAKSALSTYDTVVYSMPSDARYIHGSTTSVVSHLNAGQHAPAYTPPTLDSSSSCPYSHLWVGLQQTTCINAPMPGSGSQTHLAGSQNPLPQAESYPHQPVHQHFDHSIPSPFSVAGSIAPNDYNPAPPHVHVIPPGCGYSQSYADPHY